MFSLREAADYLKCSMSSLYTRLGELEHIKIGKRSLVTKRSCDALIERSIVSAKQVRA